ncbi:TonB-dependent receptor [Exilibacterium tricleocarpae]|uniref:TonB-dependent receptor n=1 Tax=Exilibacterium tricleocarpae TaxID=2591008 RepID=A0A545TLQ2_9GAMM|nr:TonB-dependent receptor [Exilibacterium tricleocarpae]TQV78175.1 TonB-dependent receptor [Exilibacterium tricleocarpae]
MIIRKSSPPTVGTGIQLKRTAISVAVAASLSGAVHSQPGDADSIEEVVVTGYRKSLEDAMNYKRNNYGVVDAINAEDIGKFPNTNLAEALQRIPGVSINRVNGEGSQITVRGFGPDFNQVTLNGRSLPTADVPVVGGGTDGQGTSGAGRAFDFSNLAADGIQTLEVYKTGRANVASGGIGATINVVTRRPLDNPGLQAAISAKAIADTSVDRGDSVTPEIGGNFSWTNEDETFGIGLVGSFTERDSAAASATSANWNVVTFADFQDFITPDTVLTNAPTDPEALVALPRDSRYHFSEFTGERMNGQLVVQFAPSDRLRMTADYTFAENEAEEERYDVSNWFNRPFTEVVFDDSPVQSTIFLRENADNKGAAMQQTLRATKDELDSFGFNVEFDLADNLTLTFDAHSSEATVKPNAPGGYSRINVGLDMKYAPVDGTLSQAVDYSGDIPIQIIELISTSGNSSLDSAALAALAVDTARAASQVANLRTITQENEIDQFDIRADWELDANSNLTVGANYRSQTNVTDNTAYRQILGNWGAENPGDVEALAGAGILEEFCVSCRFEDFTIGGASLDGNTRNSVVYGVRGNAADIFEALSPAYAAGYNGADPRPLDVTNSDFDEIEEDVLALYVQFSHEFQIAGRNAHLHIGMRYEDTEVSSSTSSLPTARIDWQGNNDFATFASTSAAGLKADTAYDHFLPSVDFELDVTEDVKVRASYSKTIARPRYDNLFASGTVRAPNGPTALAGNLATAEQGNPGLLPLESDNVDVSVEWYFDESSYVSIGLFDKSVRNFVGRETVSESLFGLRDVSSGAEGTRSGAALDLLDAVGADLNEDNLFAATVYIDTLDSIAAAQAEFVANQGADGNILPAVYEQLELDADLSPNADDPLFAIAVNRPLNNRDASIDGVEIQGQHFFGDTGFGITASYTVVNGDVGFNVAGAPDTSQFALTGLSDTANVTLIYEKYGISARLAYNWRDEFLSNTNDDSGFNNPIFVEEYGQVDLSIGYEITDQLSVSFAGINLNEESSRNFARSRTDMQFLRENAARYYLGLRYKF